MDKLFLEHPRAVGESYFQHLAFAFLMGLRLVGAGLACIAHSLVPAVFDRTASRTVADLHSRITGRGGQTT